MAAWMLLGRVLRVPAGPEDAEAEPAAAISIPLVAPPRVSVVTANRSVHPDPGSPDWFPYALVANAVGLLVNFSSLPFYGVYFGNYPHVAHLVVLHEFLPTALDAEAEAVLGEMTATAVRLPPRENFDPIIYNLESIGMGMGAVTRDGVTTEGIVVSELMVDTGSEFARIVYCLAGGHNTWQQELRGSPLAASPRAWVPSGVVLHDGRLWWFDLAWGILSCEVSPDAMGPLLFLGLPPGRTRNANASREGLHDHRCIAASGDALRYVEIIIVPEAAVAMWTAVPVADDDGQVTIMWEMDYQVSFAAIWNDDSYAATGLPRRLPVLTAVSPSNPGLVFFALAEERRIFGVYVPEHSVVEFVDEAYDLVMPPWADLPSSRYILGFPLQLQADDAGTRN